ncbi:MAG: hypothetical protein A3J81_06735 [Nitrospirae bacterium RIFOXYB2_FULL_43_5]|nr:MAG: hypothetical protein A2X54_09535 [Nitrospirae bacterium GWF2_44_13]OGW32585.1 MAG: hypothetical protein A2088_02455 [Nitrospirae bacterium GWD2_44_7]OGW63497.1 MAG: hypothetical protein A2222_06685 [Nitrospirae bacterium RIFOXYA2_FULL_44_9]OGW75403.1 MAG: hypothetical protein A3J81_06735 [Nitrospirae bacterium RIFOXYB2_FULL_43_5]
MRRALINWKVVFIVLFAFFVSTLMMPAFVTKTMAQEKDTNAAGTGAAAAGQEGGAATQGGIGTGTIVVGVVVAGVIAAAVISGLGSTSTTSTALSYNCVLSNLYDEYVCSTDSVATIDHYLALAHNANLTLALAHTHFNANLTNFAVSHTGSYP